MAAPRTPTGGATAVARLERASAQWLRAQRGRYPEEIEARWLRDFGVALTPLKPGEEKQADAPSYFTDALGVAYTVDADAGTDEWDSAGAVEHLRQLARTDSQQGAEAFRQHADRLDPPPPQRPGPRKRLRWNWHAVEAWYKKRLAENQKRRPQLKKFLARPDLRLVTRRPIFSTKAEGRVTVNDGPWPHLEAETFVAACLDNMSVETLRENLRKHRETIRENLRKHRASLRKAKRSRSR